MLDSENAAAQAPWVDRAPDAPVRRPRSAGWWLLALVPMLFCCGGPLILGVLATASAAALGTIGGIVGLVLLAVAVAWWLRRRRARQACCAPATRRGAHA